MQKNWTAEILGNNVVFHQQNRALSLPIKNFTKIEMKYIKIGHFCGGCRTLPFEGYDGKYDWCDFSRKIANSYVLEGKRWTDPEGAESDSEN